MIEKLKELLEQGAKDAVDAQIKNNESNLILTGRHNAFQAIINTIAELEKEEENGTDNKSEEPQDKDNSGN